MVDEIRVVELFAGVGGFRVGLEEASSRFTTIWANQWEPGKKDQFAFNCYNRHFVDSGSVNVNNDIGKEINNVPDHDLLVGGFPCQDYSVASSNAKGIEGKKGVLWWHINEILQKRSPKYMILENVDRLLKSPVPQRGRDFGIILRCLVDDGYYVEWRVVNAADYGLPQKRRRVFIFACKNDTPFARLMEEIHYEDIINSKGFFAKTFPVNRIPIQKKVSEIKIGSKQFSTLVDISDSFEGKFYNSGIMKDNVVYTRECIPVKSKKMTTLGEVLQHDVDEKYYVDDTTNWQYLKGSKRIQRTRKDGAEYCYSEGSIPFPDNLDTPGRTMLTSEGTTNRSSHIILDPETKRYRKLTPIECERLNGFPDNWTEGMSERSRYFTMGNALVVPLIKKMGERILEINKGL